MNFGCSRHSFIDRSIFIIYKNIHSRFIKDIEENQIQLLEYNIINFNCSI